MKLDSQKELAKDSLNESMRDSIAQLKKLEIISNKLVESLFSGNYRSVFKGPGMEFSEVREYAEGDDLRLIDWNVTSRMNSVFTKTFREERELVLFLLVDVSASMTSTLSTKFYEIATTIVAVFAFSATQNNDQIGAVLFSDRIEKWINPVKGRKQVFRILQDLREHELQGSGSDLRLAIRKTGQELLRRGICIIISDFKTQGYWQDLGILAKRHDVVAIRLVGPEEVMFPQTGLIEMQDAETSKLLLGFGRSWKFRKKYSDYWILQRKQWHRECLKHNINPLEMYTDIDPLTQLIRFFRRRKREG